MESDSDVIGVGYEAKLCGNGVDPEDPLYGTCYYGIAVRAGYISAQALQAERQREHECAAKSDPKEFGIRAILMRYGSHALVWRIVESKTGDRVSTQEWANEWEKNVIAAAGGVLRDIEPDYPIRQTFNLTSGGVWGDAEVWWASIEARCTAAWKKFQSAIITYVDKYKTANVPKMYVNNNGYKLGQKVNSVRSGEMLKGRRDEIDRRDFLKNLTGWVWNTDDAIWDRFTMSLVKYVEKYKTSDVPKKYIDADGYPLGHTICHVRQGTYLTNKPDEYARRSFLESQPGWVWNVNDAAWNEFKAAICKHIRKTGTAYVPDAYVDEDSYPLGRTIGNIRRGQMLNGKKDEHKRRVWLETLPDWKWKSSKAEGHKHIAAELALLRATTHPTAKYHEVGKLRNNHCVIRAHEVMRDRTVAGVIDNLLDAVIARV